MASKELLAFVEALRQEKLKDPYFKAQIGVYHASKLNPNHCLNAKWRSFKKAMVQGRHPDIPLRAKLLMQLGEMMHREIQRIVGKDYQPEQIIILPVLDFQIVCRADLVGPKEVIDIKTRWTTDGLPSKPEKDHLYQLNLYLYAFKKMQGRLWYINPVLGEDTFYVHLYDPKMTRDVIAYASQLHFCLANDIEPPHKEQCRCSHKK